MKYTLNPAVAICVGIAMTCVIGCAPTTHVTETTTTRQYDTTNPPIVAAPIAEANTRRVPNRSAIQPLIGMNTARLSV